jgi:rhodanese-related sulfurtransferase/DNA-binding transcriptional ArsR family regulator
MGLDGNTSSLILLIVSLLVNLFRAPMPADREFKNALYTQFARIGHALASPKRIELLDLLGQGEKSVEALAEHVDTPIKNTSAHLRVLRQARLVETRRDGTYILYRLADDDVFRVLRSLETLGHNRLADVQQVVRAHLDRRDALEPVTFQELRRLMREDDITVIDVRPAEEFKAGHIPGALSVPVPDIKRRLRDLPKGREIVAYCRGRYCVYALDAVTFLRKHGYRARRIEQGLPDWRVAGLPVEVGA